MVKTSTVVLGLAGVGGAAALGYYLLTRVPPAGGAVEYTLRVEAAADTTSVAIDVTVDTTSLRTPRSLSLAEGSYTITAPDSITYEGVTYYYKGWE